jgi:GAF domain-containing protein
VTTEPALDDHGAVVGLVAVISDQTQRAQLDREVRTRQLQAETLALLGAQALRQHMDPQNSATLIVGEVVDATRRVLGADRASMLDLVAVTHELQVRVSSPPLDKPVVVPAGSRSFSGYITLARRVVVVENTEHDRRFDSADEPDARPASAIGAPVVGPTGIVGTLIAVSRTAGHFSQDDAYFMQGMANIIGTALLD